ncbi:nucleoside hydrolase [Prescottella agglutinans]|uniref:Purine nucleosidase n=1 Tax=Prescottella agglutinans TaxID=1644129 RepID=A0ABT6MI20_9NOCA|nr:nucleoside hydrolase [Prescottella agglutinans]MDH6283976.1 purine nucleosidase [Prescottella agglutinans]
MTGRKVLVDTDTGVDDALALLTVLAAPDTDVVGVGSVFGNCTQDQAAANALTVLAAAGRTDIPVCIGQPRPGPPPATPSPHGRDGLGDRGLRPPGGVHPAPKSAVEQILRVSHQQPGQVDLLCLAPLTNIAVALEQDPLVLTRFRSVTIMGGMGAHSLRDTETARQPMFLAKGDTNTNHDPAAAAAVADAPGSITWVGMNVTGRLRMPWADLTARAERSTTAAFVREITENYHRYCTTTYGADEPIYTSHDSVAASVMLDPDIILSASEATGQVHHDDNRATLWGHETGPGPTHRFVTDLDYPAIRQRIDGVLKADASI